MAPSQLSSQLGSRNAQLPCLNAPQMLLSRSALRGSGARCASAPLALPSLQPTSRAAAPRHHAPGCQQRRRPLQPPAAAAAATAAPAAAPQALEDFELRLPNGNQANGPLARWLQFWDLARLYPAEEATKATPAAKLPPAATMRSLLSKLMDLVKPDK